MSSKLLKEVRAVIFDVGNTLTIPDWERINKISAQNGQLSSDEKVLQRRISEILLNADADKSFLKSLAEKSVPTGWHFQRLFTDSGLDKMRLEEFFSKLDKLHRERHLWTKINENVFDVLSKLRKDNFFIGVISNSEDGRVKDVLETIGILPFLDVYLDSYHTGFTKPQAEIFLKAVEQLGVSPAEAVYIGDSYFQDIIGARNAGLEAILYDPLNLHPEKDVIKIRSLKELLN